MNKTFVLLICLFTGIFIYSPLAAPEPYKPTLESLDSHKMPQWYDDAKIGCACTGGVYSVPA